MYLLDGPFEVKPLFEPVQAQTKRGRCRSFARKLFSLTPKVEGGQPDRGEARVMIQAVCPGPCMAAYDADGATIGISLDGRCRAGALCDSNRDFLVPLPGNTSHAEGGGVV